MKKKIFYTVIILLILAAAAYVAYIYLSDKESLCAKKKKCKRYIARKIKQFC